MIPAKAAAVPIGPAPTTPAFSNAGAKAKAVPGPPARETDPAKAPTSGFCPSALASPIPIRF